MAWADDIVGQALRPRVPSEDTGAEPVDIDVPRIDTSPWREVNREALLAHVERVYDSGIGPDVVFEPDLRVSALTPDQALFVVSPSMETDVLPYRVAMKTKRVNALAEVLKKARDADQVRVRLTGRTAGDGRPYQHVEVSSGRASCFVPTLLSPRDASTSVVQSDVRKVLDLLDEGETWPVGRTVVKELRRALRLTDANEATLRVRARGSEIQAGARTGQFGAVDYPKLDPSGDEYDLLLQADAWRAVIKAVDDWDEAELILTGPESIVAVREAGWRYVMSPLTPLEA